MSPEKVTKEKKDLTNELGYCQVKDCFTIQNIFRPDILEETYGISMLKFF